MSEMTINVIDANRAIHGRLHGSRGERLIAALSYEPTTIEELEAGMARFEAPSADHCVFEFFHSGVNYVVWMVP